MNSIKQSKLQASRSQVEAHHQLRNVCKTDRNTLISPRTAFQNLLIEQDRIIVELEPLRPAHARNRGLFASARMELALETLTTTTNARLLSASSPFAPSAKAKCSTTSAVEVTFPLQPKTLFHSVEEVRADKSARFGYTMPSVIVRPSATSPGNKIVEVVERLPWDLFTASPCLFRSAVAQDLVRSTKKVPLKALDRTLPVVEYTSESPPVRAVLAAIREESLDAKDWVKERAYSLMMSQNRETSIPKPSARWAQTFPDLSQQTTAGSGNKSNQNLRLTPLWHDKWTRAHWQNVRPTNNMLASEHGTSESTDGEQTTTVTSAAVYEIIDDDSSPTLPRKDNVQGRSGDHRPSSRQDEAAEGCLGAETPDRERETSVDTEQLLPSSPLFCGTGMTREKTQTAPSSPAFGEVCSKRSAPQEAVPSPCKRVRLQIGSVDSQL